MTLAINDARISVSSQSIIGLVPLCMCVKNRKSMPIIIGGPSIGGVAGRNWSISRCLFRDKRTVGSWRDLQENCCPLESSGLASEKSEPPLIEWLIHPQTKSTLTLAAATASGWPAAPNDDDLDNKLIAAAPSPPPPPPSKADNIWIANPGKVGAQTKRVFAFEQQVALPVPVLSVRRDAAAGSDGSSNKR